MKIHFKVNFSATDPRLSVQAGGISADRPEKDEWNKEGEFESLQTATDASTYHWVQESALGFQAGCGGEGPYQGLQ